MRSVELGSEPAVELELAVVFDPAVELEAEEEEVEEEEPAVPPKLKLGLPTAVEAGRRAELLIGEFGVP